MMSMNLSDIYTLNIKNANYHCIINGISKSAAIKLLQNNVPLKKMEHMKSNFEAINLLETLI